MAPKCAWRKESCDWWKVPATSAPTTNVKSPLLEGLEEREDQTNRYKNRLLSPNVWHLKMGLSEDGDDNTKDTFENLCKDLNMDASAQSEAWQAVERITQNYTLEVRRVFVF